MFDDHADDVVKEVCLDIEKRYQMKFLEIGTDKDHTHFLVQSVTTYSLHSRPYCNEDGGLTPNFS